MELVHLVSNFTMEPLSFPLTIRNIQQFPDSLEIVASFFSQPRHDQEPANAFALLLYRKFPSS